MPTMLGPVIWLKLRLSTLNRNAWHAKLTEFAWGSLSRKAKACPYWWLIVPSSPLVAGGKVIGFVLVVIVGAILAVIFAAVWVAIVAVCYAFGYRAEHWWLFSYDPNKDKVKLVPYYKMPGSERPSSLLGRLMKIPGWLLVMAAIAALPIWGIVSASSSIGSAVNANWDIFSYTVGGLTGLVVLGLLYSWIVRPIYLRLCPPVTWVDPAVAE